MNNLEEVKKMFIETLEGEQWLNAPNKVSFNGIIKNDYGKYIVLFTSNNWINKAAWDYCYNGCAAYGYKGIYIVRFEETNNTFKRYTRADLAFDQVGKEICYSSYKGTWSVTRSPVYYFNQNNPIPQFWKEFKKNNPTLKDLQKLIKELISGRIEDKFQSAEEVDHFKSVFFEDIDHIFADLQKGKFKLEEVTKKANFFEFKMRDWLGKMQKDIASMFDNFNQT